MCSSNSNNSPLPGSRLSLPPAQNSGSPMLKPRPSYTSPKRQWWFGSNPVHSSSKSWLYSNNSRHHNTITIQAHRRFQTHPRLTIKTHHQRLQLLQLPNSTMPSRLNRLCSSRLFRPSLAPAVTRAATSPKETRKSKPSNSSSSSSSNSSF